MYLVFSLKPGPSLIAVEFYGRMARLFESELGPINGQACTVRQAFLGRSSYINLRSLISTFHNHLLVCTRIYQLSTCLTLDTLVLLPVPYAYAYGYAIWYAMAF